MSKIFEEDRNIRQGRSKVLCGTLKARCGCVSLIHRRLDCQEMWKVTSELKSSLLLRASSAQLGSEAKWNARLQQTSRNTMGPGHEATNRRNSSIGFWGIKALGEQVQGGSLNLTRYGLVGLNQPSQSATPLKRFIGAEDAAQTQITPGLAVPKLSG